MQGFALITTCVINLLLLLLLLLRMLVVGNVHTLQADLTQRSERENLLSFSLETFGDSKPCILINNVGSNIRKPTVEFSAEE